MRRYGILLGLLLAASALALVFVSTVEVKTLHPKLKIRNSQTQTSTLKAVVRSSVEVNDKKEGWGERDPQILGQIVFTIMRSH